MNKKSQKLTIIDIAKLAGVSKSTVSRVLTGHAQVKSSTRENVKRVIKEFSFTPLKSAQVMGGGTNKVIGIIVSRLSSPSENQVVSGLLEAIYANGYDALIMESLLSVRQTNEHLAVLSDRKVDGIILFGFSGYDLNHFESLEIPSVLIAVESLKVSSVDYDHREMIKKAIQYFLFLGKKDISFIGVKNSDKTTGEMRLEAYLDACEEYHIQPVFELGGLCHQSGYDLTDKVLKETTTAIACATDTIAIGVAKRLQELHRTDVCVSGVGATEMLPFLFKNTFSIDPGYYSAGKKAVQLLFKQLTGDMDIINITQQSFPQKMQ